MMRSTSASPGRRRTATVVVLLVSAALVLTGCKFDGAYDLPLPGNNVSKDDSFEITADFADALNVVPRSAVMVDDVPVGQVTEVDRKGWHARISMRVRKDIKLPENAQVDVRQTSLLGEKYIALIDPPAGTEAAGRLKEGSFIPLSRTGRNPEVEEVLGALSMVLSGGGVGQIRTIAVELNKMLNGRQDQARDLLSQLNATVGTLDGQKQDIITALESVDKLAVTLAKEEKTIGAALDAMGPALKVLNEQHAALMKMLEEMDKLSVVGQRVLSATKDDLVATLKHLQPVLARLADAGDALPKGLALLASFPFPKEAANIARGDYANALFKMDIDLNQLIKNPGDFGPDLIGLCATTPLAPICKNLPLDQLKKLCKAIPNNPLCDLIPGGGGGGGGGLPLPGGPKLPGIPKVPGLPGLRMADYEAVPFASPTGLRLAPHDGLIAGGLGTASNAAETQR